MAEFVEVTIKAGTTIEESGVYYAENTTVTRSIEEAEEMEEKGYLIDKKTTPSSDDVLTFSDVHGDWVPE